MSLENRATIKCPYCGEDMEVTFYDSINVTLDKELKQKVLDKEIYDHKCPHCHKIVYRPFAFTYHDMDKKFMVHYDCYEELFNLYKDMNEKFNDNNEYTPCFKEIKQYAVKGYGDLSTIILCEDHDYDYKVVRVLLNSYEMAFQEQFKEDEKFKNVTIENSFLRLMDNKVMVCFEVYFNDEKHTTKTAVRDFDEDDYKKFYNDHHEKLEGTFDYLFNRECAYKYMYLDEQNIIKQASNEKCKLAIIEMPDGDDELAYIPTYNVDKFDIDDYVVVRQYDKYTKARIINLISFNCFNIPVNSYSQPNVMYKVHDVSTITTKGSNDKIDNDMFKKLLAFKTLNISRHLKNDVVIGVTTTMEISEKEEALIDNNDIDGLQKALVDDTGRIYNAKSELVVSTNERHEDLLSIYLDNNEDILKDSTKLVVSFEHAIDLVLNNPEKFQGIRIFYNDKYIDFSNDYLIDKKQTELMNNPTCMKLLLKAITPKEKHYVGRNNYNVIYKVYYESKSPKEIAKEYELDEKIIHESLDEGYRGLVQVVKFNYLY